MANFTPVYALKLPTDEDFYNVADQNENMEKLEQALKGKAGVGADGALALDQVPDYVARAYCHTFRAADWQPGGIGMRIRIPKTAHGIRGVMTGTARMLVGRNVEEYRADTLSQAKTAVLDCMGVARSASWPVNGGGYISLGWHTVQYYLLTGTLLTEDAALSIADAQGFSWSGRDSADVSYDAAGAATLSEISAAAYTTSLGGSSAVFDRIMTLDAVRALRLRRLVPDAAIPGANYKYDIDGEMVSNVWGGQETVVKQDGKTGDVVVECPYDTGYAGQVVLIG